MNETAVYAPFPEVIPFLFPGKGKYFSILERINKKNTIYLFSTIEWQAVAMYGNIVVQDKTPDPIVDQHDKGAFYRENVYLGLIILNARNLLISCNLLPVKTYCCAGFCLPKAAGNLF